MCEQLNTILKAFYYLGRDVEKIRETFGLIPIDLVILQYLDEVRKISIKDLIPAIEKRYGTLYSYSAISRSCSKLMQRHMLSIRESHKDRRIRELLIRKFGKIVLLKIERDLTSHKTGDDNEDT